MNPARLALAVLSLSLGLVSARALAEEPRWKQHTINGKSAFEAAAAFDVDNDGKLDVVSGDTWYQGPGWTPHHVRNVVKQGTYYNCFATLPFDVNGDGKTDYVTCGYFSKNVGWVENPGKPGADWTYHEIDLPGTSEAAVAVDLTGDGQPEVLPNSTNVVVWYDLEKKGSEPIWKKHDFGKQAAGHGVGTGDVNGDGRVDLLTPKGWFEGPGDPKNATWTWHPDWNLGATGIQILARDIDGDGLSDVVWGVGHNYGLYWMRQEKASEPGKRAFSAKMPIDETIASVHTLLWADLNGDGKDDELATGKRVYAHEVEAGATDAPVIASYRFDRDTKAWTKNVIFKGEPAKDAPAKAQERNAQKDFAPGTAGTGLQMTAIDMDKDGDLDLLCPGKSGLYWFENLGKGE